MDDPPRVNVRASFPRLRILFVAVIAVGVGCRIPDSVLQQFLPRQGGIVHDTAWEHQSLHANAPPVVRQAFDSPYGETLAEPVAVTQCGASTYHWDIMVATNRGWFDDPGHVSAANRVLDEVRYGRCDVEISKEMRGVERALDSDEQTPAKLTSKREQPLAHVSALPLSEEEFLQGVNDQVDRSRQRDLLVFVHGFNVSFEAAIARTAQLGLDIPFNGAMVAYCWPTQGGVLSYEGDEPINQASVAPFTEFLDTLLSGVPPETRIHIVVHSMGNRIVMESLDSLPTPVDRKPFANVVLCAPDVGRSDFLAWAPGVIQQCQRLTVYANSADAALIASKGIHGELRAGDATVPVIVEGAETIDCTDIDTSFMGHSYYGSNSDMLTDLFMLLKEDRPAAKRPHLKRRKSGGGAYWEFSGTPPSMIYVWHFGEEAIP